MCEPGDLVLVTGANGFLGSHLVESLLAAGMRVRCMVRRSRDQSFIRHLPVEWAYADVSSAAGLPAACRGVDSICHCAALTRAPNQETFFRVNTDGTTALARAALEAGAGLKRFLFVSSLAAAGPSLAPDDVLDEWQPPHPITWYGKSKWAAEQALLNMCNGDQPLPVTIVRPAAVFGPRDRDFFANFRLIQRGLNLQLDSERRALSLIYVHDLVDLILLALQAPQALGQTYFASAWVHSHAELCCAIARALNHRAICLKLPRATLVPMSLWSRAQCRITGRPPLLNDQRVLDLKAPYWVCSAARAARELGFAPRYDLAGAVRETADWYREQGWL